MMVVMVCSDYSDWDGGWTVIVTGLLADVVVQEIGW